MKKFFKEFGDFIKRGSVVDLAVGVIIGSAFTAIVTALSDKIIMPVINYILTLILGKNSLTEVFTFLKKGYTETGTIDLASSIYIDWGAFISAIIKFIIIAFVLFTIVKTINNIQKRNEKLKNEFINSFPTKEEKKEMKKAGIKLRDKEAVKKFRAEKEERLALEKKQAEEQAKIKAEEDRIANPTTEDLLKEILATLKKEEK